MSKKAITFNISQKDEGTRARTGVIHTPHGDIETPAFVIVGTKATIKGITPGQFADVGIQTMLANTY
ncbi:MAG: tRNA-guanine transglycosylase, partial [Candidatus Paceibacterota bacterium]